MFSKNKNKRFKVMYEQGTVSHCKIIVDTETGINYFFADNGGYVGGITVLLDKDGKPVISTAEELGKYSV